MLEFYYDDSCKNSVQEGSWMSSQLTKFGRQSSKGRNRGVHVMMRGSEW